MLRSEPEGDSYSESEEFRVPVDVAAVFGRDVVVEIDRGDRTLGLAGTAVDAYVWIDEHLDAGVSLLAFGGRYCPKLIERDWADNAVAGTDVDARGIARADALLGDHVCHDLSDDSRLRAVDNHLKRRRCDLVVTDISVVSNAISVNAPLMNDGLRVASRVLDAISDAHTPRALARAIASGLAPDVRFRRLELHAVDPEAIVELDHGDWRSIDTPRDRDVKIIAPGLAVALSDPLPDAFSTPEFRDLLGRIVHMATRHMDVVQRVAKLSRRAHVKTRDLRADLERLEPSSEIVARSAVMRDVLARARLVASHPTTVLITGESGAGKEVLAREIHRRSPRGHRPMLQLNCGAIPEHLVESELFGHERGAFTGAERAHVGVFERADRGTLFLDEVGELPLAAQVKLLRVLQERQIRRVGATAQIDVDVRLIAATNRPLAAMVASGAFREDLYYRLDVFGLRVPPLRDRRGDFGPLVSALVGELANKLGMEAPPVTRGTLSKLESHDWPGNVRELMNVLETALILGDGRSLDLPDEFVRRSIGRASEAARPRFEGAVRHAIEESLRATRGKIYGVDGAAARLGLKPGTLQSKMRKLGLRRDDFCSG